MKKQIIRIKTALLFFLFIIQNITAQKELPQIIPASTEAAAVAKYVNFPVEPRTGIANVAIPLYELKCGSLTLPITLSYHGSGLKVRENDGWIALGWTLNAAPTITRSIKGNPDERKNGLLNNPGFSDERKREADYYSKLEKGLIDGEPDSFYYKLTDRSGEFFIEHPTAKARTIPYDPIDITYYIDKSNSFYHDITAITILDENGVQYNFADTEITYDNSNNKIGITGWKITKIISPDKVDTIQFVYSTAMETTYQYADFIVIQDMAGSGAGFPDSEGSFPFIQIHSSSNINEPVKKYSLHSNGEKSNYTGNYTIPESGGKLYNKYTISTKKLVEIEYRGGKVGFLSSADINASPKLNDIAIYNNRKGTGKPIKKIQFTQKCYGNIAQEGNRYNLETLEIKNEESTTIQKYQFEYYGSGTLPHKDKSQSFDHWGYYNAVNDGINCGIPRMTIECVKNLRENINIKIGEADRNSNEEAMKTGMLKKIKYPTGTTTTFYYETNRFYDERGNFIKGGGLRIKRMTTGPYETVYAYGKPSTNNSYEYSSTGTPKWITTDDDYMCERNIVNQGYNIGNTRVRTFYTQTLADLFYTNGSPVLYDEVREFNTDQEWPDDEPMEYLHGVGWTSYQYSQRWWDPGTRIKGTPFYFIPLDAYSTQSLAKKEIYKVDSESGVDTVVVKDYTHEHFGNDPYNKEYGTFYPHQRVYRNTICMCDYCTNSGNVSIHDNYIYIPTELYRYYYSTRIKTEKTTEKYGIHKLVSTKTYEYNSNSRGKIFINNPLSIVSVDPEFNWITDKFEYAFNASRTGDAEIARLKLLENKQYTTLLKKTVDKGSIVIQGTEIEYCVSGNGVYPKIIKEKLQNSSIYENRLQYHKYDNYGNPVYITKDDLTSVVYLWSYNGQYPVAEIKNATYDQVKSALGNIAPESLSSSATPNMSLLNGLRDNKTYLNNAHISTYTYKPSVGILSVTNPSAITIYYGYDMTNRLQKVYLIESGKEKVIQSYHYNYSNKW